MPSIGVLEHFQKPTDKPSRRIKKAGGHSLVNRGMAFWLRENVLLQMHCLTEARSLECTPKPRTYIPEHLPANIDAMLGVIDQSPVLSEQVRFRHI